jgi:molecular chaperone HtpG
MRGIRLRKDNIQIGDEDTLQKLFKEDRGNSYFVGEVYAISKDLIPNSQRNYFNENPVRNEFELQLRQCFEEKLKSAYYTGSAINSANKKIADFESEREEFSAKQSSGLFVNDEDKQNAIDELNKKQEAAEQAIKDIETKKRSAPNNPIIAKLIDRVEKTHKEQVQFLPTTTETIDNNTAKTTDPRNNEWRASKLSPYGYSRKEIKLISKIFGIIVSVTDKENAEFIISKIEDGLQGKQS